MDEVLVPSEFSAFHPHVRTLSERPDSRMSPVIMAVHGLPTARLVGALAHACHTRAAFESHNYRTRPP